MKTSVLIWSIALAAAPVGAQHAAETKPAAATAVAAKPAEAKPATAKPATAKPAAATATKKTSSSAESAAERIMRRLDAEFPKQKGTTKTAESRPLAKPLPAHTSTGTTTAPRASNRVTLTWRIALHWPDEIAPARQVK